MIVMLIHSMFTTPLLVENVHERMTPTYSGVKFRDYLLSHTIGDEVLEWNGLGLRGATEDEVHLIILESKQEPQIELVVQRKCNPYVLLLYIDL